MQADLVEGNIVAVWLLFERFVHHWADWASVSGVLISVIGFAVTIAKIMRSKRTSEQVKQAVEDVRQHLATVGTVGDLSNVVGELEDIKQLHRHEVWPLLPARYSAVRKHLYAIKGSEANLSKRHKGMIQGAIQNFLEIEQIVEDALAAKKAPDDPAGLNRLVSDQADKLISVVVAMQRQAGE